MARLTSISSQASGCDQDCLFSDAGFPLSREWHQRKAHYWPLWFWESKGEAECVPCPVAGTVAIILCLRIPGVRPRNFQMRFLIAGRNLSPTSHGQLRITRLAVMAFSLLERTFSWVIQEKILKEKKLLSPPLFFLEKIKGAIVSVFLYILGESQTR